MNLNPSNGVFCSFHLRGRSLGSERSIHEAAHVSRIQKPSQSPTLSLANIWVSSAKHIAVAVTLNLDLGFESAMRARRCVNKLAECSEASLSETM